MRGDSPLTEGLPSKEVRGVGRDRVVICIYMQNYFKPSSTFRVLPVRDPPLLGRGPEPAGGRLGKRSADNSEHVVNQRSLWALPGQRKVGGLGETL